MIEPNGDSVYFAGGLLAAGVGPSLAVVMVTVGAVALGVGSATWRRGSENAEHFCKAGLARHVRFESVSRCRRIPSSSVSVS